MIRVISKVEALNLIFENHYSKVMPSITKYYLGYFENNILCGVMTLGYGTRPLHTIKKLFPNMDSTDYLEIGKMAMLESMPKNSESKFLSSVVKWLKINLPNLKILFTWADGILGKPGYVYQAANFLYGGYIWTDLYLTADGEKIHPRTSQKLKEKSDNVRIGHRPSKDDLIEKNWKHIKGKQFRYIYPLKKNLLLTEKTDINWKTPYPKHCDLEWQIRNLNLGIWEKETDITKIGITKVTDNINKISTRTSQNLKQVETYKLTSLFFG